MQALIQRTRDATHNMQRSRAAPYDDVLLVCRRGYQAEGTYGAMTAPGRFASLYIVRIGTKRSLFEFYGPPFGRL